MLLEERRAGSRDMAVLDGLQFAIDGRALRVGLRGFAGVQLDKLVGEVADGHLLALLQAPAPERLQGRAVGRAFADLQGDHFRVEDIGHDLAPDLGFGAAARGADLGRFHAQLRQPAQAVVHAQRHAFHRGAGEVAGLEGLLVHAEPDAGAVRHVGGALAFEVGQQQQAVASPPERAPLRPRTSRATSRSPRAPSRWRR